MRAVSMRAVSIVMHPAVKRSAKCGYRCAYGWMMAAALVMPLSAQSHQAGTQSVEGHGHRRQIDRLEEEWRTAVLNSNTHALSSLLADDYMAITAFGTLETKDQTLAGYRSGSLHFTTLNISDRKVRFYNHTALVTSQAEVRATTPEGRVDGGFRYTHVYVRNMQGAWKIVSFEASRMRKPGGRR